MFFRIIKYNFKNFITKSKLIISIFIFIIISLNTYDLIQVIPKVTEFNINTFDNIMYTFGGIYNYLVHSKLEYIINLIIPYIIVSAIIASFLEGQIHGKVYVLLTRIKSLKTWYSGLLVTVGLSSIIYVILGYVTISIVPLFKSGFPISYSSHLQELFNLNTGYYPVYIIIIFSILQILSILNISSIQLTVSILSGSSIKGLISGLSFYTVSAFIGNTHYNYFKFMPGFQIVISRNNILGMNSQGVDIWWSIIYNLTLYLLIYSLSVYTLKKVDLKF